MPVALRVEWASEMPRDMDGARAAQSTRNRADRGGRARCIRRVLHHYLRLGRVLGVAVCLCACAEWAREG